MPEWEELTMSAVPVNLWEWLAPIEPDERFALCITLVVFGILALVIVVGLMALTIFKIHRTRVEAALKRELLDRGLSVEEIASVITATSGGKHLGSILPPPRG
jgi:hypothetical protein